MKVLETALEHFPVHSVYMDVDMQVSHTEIMASKRRATMHCSERRMRVYANLDQCRCGAQTAWHHFPDS